MAKWSISTILGCLATCLLLGIAIEIQYFSVTYPILALAVTVSVFVIFLTIATHKHWR